MSYLTVETDHRGVTTLTLNRPRQHNALNRQLIDELTETLYALHQPTRVLVLASNGNNFCAGADINWMREGASLGEEGNRDDALAFSNCLKALNDFPKPTIARVQGAALGGGTGIVCCCDIVVANEAARFAFSETRLGIIPATISPYALQAIGPRQARRYFLTAEAIDALEAYRIGLVHDVCSSDNLHRRVEEKISELLECSSTAQGAAKQLIPEVAGRIIDDDLREQLAALLAAIRATDDAQEGLAAFLEKRPARWVPAKDEVTS